MYLQEIGARAQAASRKLATCSSQVKNQALAAMALALEEDMAKILAANAVDVAAAREKGVGQALLDRLALTEVRVRDMANGLRALIGLEDPIGKVDEGWVNYAELDIHKVRVPFGVVGMIYEARPNVTADAAGLCLKSGNAVILRGSSDARASNQAIYQALDQAIVASGLPQGTINLISEGGREIVTEMLHLNAYIDVLIPRGGAGLIKHVLENATVPVIETGTGNCHLYIDDDADLAKGLAILLNGKVQRPGVCNALETLLVHEAVAEAFLPEAIAALLAAGVAIRGCVKTQGFSAQVTPATEMDYHTEFHDMIIAVQVVDSMEAAMEHIHQHGTKHSEVIITENYQRARTFSHQVDAACVYVNASSRFSDGFEFGFGAEIGISTQKLHARGPMGLLALTSYKYIILGEGQVRQ